MKSGRGMLNLSTSRAECWRQMLWTRLAVNSKYVATPSILLAILAVFPMRLYEDTSGSQRRQMHVVINKKVSGANTRSMSVGPLLMRRPEILFQTLLSTSLSENML